MKRKKSSSRKTQPRRAKDIAAEALIVARAHLPTRFGRFTILGVQGRSPGETAVVLQHGRVNRKGGKGSKTVPLVRVHSQCLTGDVFTSERCDCRAQLELSLRLISRAPAGLLVYLPQEGRGIGLLNKLRAYELQDAGMDTVEANLELGFADDARDYRFSAKTLALLGARRVRLLSNNPEKVRQLAEAGIEVVERIPCQPRATRSSRAYLRTKKTKLGHLLSGF